MHILAHLTVDANNIKVVNEVVWGTNCRIQGNKTDHRRGSINYHHQLGEWTSLFELTSTGSGGEDSPYSFYLGLGDGQKSSAGQDPPSRTGPSPTR